MLQLCEKGSCIFSTLHETEIIFFNVQGLEWKSVAVLNAISYYGCCVDACRNVPLGIIATAYKLHIALTVIDFVKLYLINPVMNMEY